MQRSRFRWLCPVGGRAGGGTVPIPWYKTKTLQPYVAGEIPGFKENTEHCRGDERWHLEAIPAWLSVPAACWPENIPLGSLAAVLPHQGWFQQRLSLAPCRPGIFGNTWGRGTFGNRAVGQGSRAGCVELLRYNMGHGGCASGELGILNA